MRRGHKSKYDRHSWHCSTWRLKCKMEYEGIKWMPPRDKRDNVATNYDSKNEVEKEYIEFLKKMEDTLQWLIEQYTNEDGTIDTDLYEDEYYLFLTMTPKERLSVPDSKFIGDGTWNSITWPYQKGKASAHKGGRYTKIRVPSLKRGKSTWQKFYNEFPMLAAEVRWGNTRFINGAKLKYIW